MSIHKLFILGRPGSGKSGVAQLINRRLQGHDWFVKHLFDYPLLQRRFRAEVTNNVPVQERKFRARGPGILHGFDVVKFSVMDEVLVELISAVSIICNNNSVQENRLLLIEFARKDYRNALSLFGHTLLQDAHILYIDAHLEHCIERIQHRLDSQSPYNHYVSNDIMRQYYLHDDWQSECRQYLASLGKLGIRIYPHYIANTGSYEELDKGVENFVNMSFLRETEAVPIPSKLPSPIESGK